jgi:formylglycine-generating enzyme required for sulfatase activity
MQTITALAFFSSALWCAAVAHADTFGSGANTFDIEFVTIGDPFNPPDTTGDPDFAGSVSYTYRIGKYEISEQMIDKANALGGLGITKDPEGLSGPNKPATGMSWYEALRFINWLNTSTGNHVAYKIESGVAQSWQPTDPGYIPGNSYRNSLAKYFLPDVREWYKAAYYDPKSGVYYDYPTGSDIAPMHVHNGQAANTAVYRWGEFVPAGPADITLAGGLSPYGTMAQGGNAMEWEETDCDLINDQASQPSSCRGLRGGSWAQGIFELSASFRGIMGASRGSEWIGFRVVADAGIQVPEPGTLLLLAAIATVGLAMRRRRVR